MRTAKLVSMFAGVVFMCSQLLIAQEVPKDQLFIVREEVARVDMWDKYESTSKQWVEMMTKGGLDLPYVRASQRDDGHYYYLIPINNYADVDKLPGIFGSAIEKSGKDKWTEFMVENEGSMVTHRDYVVRLSAEYSYVPKEPRLKMEDAKFIHWMYFHFKLENRQELLAILKEWKKLYEDKNIKNGYNVWIVELGLDNNMMVLTESFKDGADFYTSQKEDNALMEAEANALWAKMAPMVTSIDNKYGSPRPDLGYIKK